MTPRIRRLHADNQRIQAAFQDHPYIRLIDTEGTPPEKYTFEFKVAGLVPTEGDSCKRALTHRAEVFLLRDYPRRPPFCRMITPVFHPNIDPQKICIGDHWSAGESLAHLVVRIGEMICYQSYNVKSPLNGKAAAWAEQHVDELPIVREDLTVGV
ncbi:MAG: ubiquitin-conjugating enzyme E2 [bacterium]